MNNINLNIVANAQFQQVYAEVAKLKEAMLSLQKTSVGGPFTPTNTASIRQAQQAFDSAVLSTRAFNIEQVAMTSNVERFGKQLKAGQLSLSNYYKIWKDSVKGTSAELDALATSQARLNRSIAIADPLRPGYAKLVTDINGVVTAQEKAIFYQKALNTAMQQGAIKLIDFGKNTQWMGRQLTVGLTMPLAMFGAGVSSAFLNVDKELTRMQKVYGSGLVQPTQQALKQIRSDVQALGGELARTLGTSVQDTAAMAADLAATGLEGQKLIGATRESIRLATLGELDHQQAMQATISLQNVYKLSTKGLTEAVNFLNAVENQTSTSLQDLVDAIPRVGPIVAQLGGSFKDTAAMMVAMKEAGVPAAQGANAIKSALSSLINPTKAAQTAFQAYNINVAAIAKQSGGSPILMLKSLAEQMKNLDKVTQAQLIEKMFGKFQFARIQALLDNINKSGTQTATVFQLMGASSTQLAQVAANELKQQTESASGRFKRMIETVKADLLPIGNMFLNSFTRIGNVVDKIVSAFKTIAHAMGPAAKIFGLIGGAGLTGLIVAGPIIMLTGLFANLIGNILRGVNAIRMFRQGAEQAGAGENKFLAGLHGMRNFYEDLDKSMIAARNQMELMPEAITSNAKAFDILIASIRDLTIQFQTLATAQAEAMGLGAVKSPISPFKIPFSGMATGGWVPGSPAQGDNFPAMLTGKEFVVPYPQSVQYAPFLNAIQKNQLPGYHEGGELAHMAGNFQPGSTQHTNFMAANPGLAKFAASGGTVDILSNLTARLPHEINAQLRDNAAKTADFERAWTSGSPLKFAESATKGGMSIDELRNPKMQLAMQKLEDTLLARVKGLNKDILGDEDIYAVTQKLLSERKGLTAEEIRLREVLEEAAQTVGGYRTRFADASAAEMLLTKQIEQIPSTTSKHDVYGKLAVGGQAVGEYGGSDPNRTRGLSRNLYAPGAAKQRAIDEIRADAKQNILAAEMSMKEQAGIASPAQKFADEIGVPISQGVAKGIKVGGASVTTAVDEMVAMVGEQLSLFEDEAMVAGQATAEKYALGAEETITKETPKLRSKIKSVWSNMGTAGQAGVSMGLMMGGSMLGSAVGGVAGSSISSAAMMGSMTSMFQIAPELRVAVAALAAAVPLVTAAFKTLSDGVREQANAFKSSLQVSSQAVDYFHLKFTPMAQYDYSGVTTNISNHIKSIKDNKVAVDQLTQAYISATDQMTKDYIANVKKSSGTQLESKMKERYATNVASGMTTAQALQDITSIMNAAGISSMTQSGVRSKMNQKMTATAGFEESIGAIKAPQMINVGPSTARAGASFAGAQAAKYQKYLESMTTSLVNLGGVNTKTFAEITKNMGQSTREVINSKPIYEAFAKNIANGDAKVLQFSKDFKTAGGNTIQLAQATRLLNAGLYKSDEIIAMIHNRKFDKTFMDNIDKLLKLEQQSSGNGQGGGGGGGGGPADYSKQFTPLIKRYEAIKKLIDTQTSAQKKYNDQLKLTQDYHQKQMDYYNQMKMAFTSGNYLGAMLAQTGSKASQADFKAQMQDAKNQDMQQNVQDLLSRLQEGASSGQTLSQFLKNNKVFTTKLDNINWQKQLFGGVDQKTFTGNTASIIAKANAAVATGTSAANSGAFQTLVVNVSADNSVVPETFANTVATKVLQAQKTVAAKTGTSNKITAPPAVAGAARGGK